MVQILSSPALELPRLELEEYMDLCCLLPEHLEDATDSELPLKEAALMEDVLGGGGAATELEEEMVESLLCWAVSSWLAKEEKVTGLLAQPLSRLDMEARLPLVGLMSWGDPALLGVDTKVPDCLLVPGWKVECLAASL